MCISRQFQDEAQKKAGDKAKESKKNISSVLYELKYDVKTHGYVPKELEKRVTEEVSVEHFVPVLRQILSKLIFSISLPIVPP